MSSAIQAQDPAQVILALQQANAESLPEKLNETFIGEDLSIDRSFIAAEKAKIVGLSLIVQDKAVVASKELLLSGVGILSIAPPKTTSDEDSLVQLYSPNLNLSGDTIEVGPKVKIIEGTAGKVVRCCFAVFYTPSGSEELSNEELSGGQKTIKNWMLAREYPPEITYRPLS